MVVEVSRWTARVRLADLWALIKGRQTALLLFTGLSAYTLTRRSAFDPLEAAWLTVGLLLSISGCTVLNMLLDQDIDARMARTACRPLPAGHIRPMEAAAFGGLLSVAGVTVSFALDPRAGTVGVMGFAFNLLIYTAWLKRRTPLAVLFGGVAGGMPALAGRVLALGSIDLVGLLLASSILFWVPTHVLTIALRYADDYRQAGVPVLPNVYGPRATRLVIAGGNLLNALAVAACALLLQVHLTALALLLGISLAMFGLAALQLVRPTDERNWFLFKVASLYMLLSSLLLVIGSLV